VGTKKWETTDNGGFIDFGSDFSIEVGLDPIVCLIGVTIGTPRRNPTFETVHLTPDQADAMAECLSTLAMVARDMRKSKP
jgi:hypothetical protein